MLYAIISWFVNHVYHYQINLFNPYFESYFDEQMLKWPWLVWLLILVSVTFVIPVIIFVLLYVTTLTMFIYGHRQELELNKINDLAHKNSWKMILYLIAIIWEAHGKIWHGFEVEGFENIPDNGPALLVFYHGAIPLDHYYLIVKCLLYKKRLINAVGDNFLFMIPGWRRLMKELKVLPGPAQECVKILKKGNILSISPGGVREAQFGDENYKLIWKNRIGFAKVAIEAKVPIIPMFTMNIREAFVSMKVGRGCLKRIYEKTKLPVVPVYGGFPVKLKTIIGNPIPYDPTVTPEQLAKRTHDEIDKLIKQHQRLPGSITHALLDRLHKCNHKTCKRKDE